MSRTYCLVVDYSVTGAKKQLRARAVPITFSNFTLASGSERLLRLDMPSTSENSATCSGTVNAPVTGTVGNADSAFTPADLCPTCTSISSSTKVRLYYSSSSTISESTWVPTDNLNTTSLGLRVNPEPSSSTGQALCDIASCSAKGYDCCLDGQCVKDGATRPNATSNSDYAQAVADVSSNPLNFIFWPQIYYICTNITHPQATPTALPDAASTANAALAKDKKEYYCLEEGKKSSPDYTVGVCSNSAYLTPGTCSGAGGTWTYYCYPTGLSSDYVNIRNDVWGRCGCQATPFPTDPTDPRCPDFGLKAIFDSSNNIVQVLCDNPPPDVGPTPFQDLTVKVSSRSVPHRFFRASDGASIDDISTVMATAPTTTQEGTEFSYLIESSHSGPQNVANNINAVLGQMNINLSKALPAKTINVEYDQTYIVSAISGIYSPCPTCAKDSWFQAFSAFPTTSYGKGLQAIGHTTKRDLYVTNVTNGNYEDTLFGRACYVPVTMLPFTHTTNATLATQRQNRLEAQAALYINGYHRDWYGFNYGALIGSFDGVRWFAIGQGRRVKAKSTKLFLAINAPFADLADLTNISVHITLDQGGNDAADYDYDPNLDISDARQNQAGTCQRYHQCQTDSDCVSQLGWEYMCADVTKIKFNLPKFDSSANETANDQFSNVGPTNLIGDLPSGSTKRCIYRGAGAPCVRNFDQLSTLYPTPSTSKDAAYDPKVRPWACAPNFFCAQSSQNYFNQELVRTPNEIFDVFYGQDTNILGRPLSYSSATSSLSSLAQSALSSQRSIIPTVGPTPDMGVCRPGKYLDTNNYVNQMAQADSSKRADGINQISSCRGDLGASSGSLNLRTRSCPAIGQNSKDTKRYGNHIIYDSTNTENDNSFALRNQQNMCGKETQSSAGVSPFANLELTALTLVDRPSLYQYACYRRAGSICFSDYDCGPNQLHANEVAFYGSTFFGSTKAERRYWQEYLVCGQGEAVPSLNASTFSTYDLKQNRCCREVAKDLSMYTQVTNTNLVANQYGATSASCTVAENDCAPNTSLIAADETDATSRYSRYSIVYPFTASPTYATPVATRPYVHGSLRPVDYQWKTINDTGKLSCCGGGFIRKFADGTHNWAKRDRLKLDLTSLACLNYRNNLGLPPADVSTISNWSTSLDNILGNLSHRTQWNSDYDSLCQAPGSGGELGGNNSGPACLQLSLAPASSFEITPPSIDTSAVADVKTLRLTPKDGEFPYYDYLHSDAPYLPRLAKINGYYNPSSYETFPTQYIMTPNITDVSNLTGRHSLEIFLPVYISRANIADVRAVYFDANNKEICKESLGRIDDTVNFDCPTPSDGAGGFNYHNNATVAYNNRYCFHDYNSQAEVLIARTWFSTTTPCTNVLGVTDTWSYAGIEIDYRSANSTHFSYINAPGTSYTSSATQANYNRLNPGNTLYYLTKLGRLDLLGIPQIFYEPLSCNSDQSLLVPKLFLNNSLAEIYTTSAFSADVAGVTTGNANTLMDMYTSTGLALGADPSNTAQSVVYQEKINLPAIFSAHEFMCCHRLGDSVNQASDCCSNHAITDPSNANKKICKLPSGVDLNVYFNRFVSSEGYDSDKALNLEDKDFIPETGEPKLTQTVLDKISALGLKHCESGQVRNGALIGKYIPAPFPGFYYGNTLDPDDFFISIADSPLDVDAGKNGYPYFYQGFHWNHHIYCDNTP